MTQITVTFDDEKWAVVPREATTAMFAALTPWMEKTLAKVGPDFDHSSREAIVALAMAQWCLGSFAADYKSMIDAAPKLNEADRQ